AEGARVGAHRHRAQAGRRTGCQRPHDRGRSGRRTRPPHRCDPGAAALDARPGRGSRGGQAVTRSLAGWAFAAPALLVILVFFFLPVVAALGLSVTDFDIYALADIGNLRFVAFDNCIGLLHDPLFWKTLGNTLYFVVVGVPLAIALSLAAAVLLHSKLGRFKGFFRTAFF